MPADWPDGTEVEIHPLGERMRHECDTISAEEIARTLAGMDQIQPFDMTDAERVAWETDRQARKEREKSDFTGHAEKLRRMWE